MGVVRYSLIVINLAFVLLCGYVVWSSREHPVINGVRLEREKPDVRSCGGKDDGHDASPTAGHMGRGEERRLLHLDTLHDPRQGPLRCQDFYV